MVGRADHNGVDLIVHLVKQVAEIAEPLGLGILCICVLGPLVINVAQSHEILALHSGNHTSRAAATADDRKVEFLVGRLALVVIGQRTGIAAEPETGPGQCNRFQYIASAERLVI